MIVLFHKVIQFQALLAAELAHMCVKRLDAAADPYHQYVVADEDLAHDRAHQVPTLRQFYDRHHRGNHNVKLLLAKRVDDFVREESWLVETFALAAFELINLPLIEDQLCREQDLNLAFIC
jgi:hypothetical protein